MKLSKLKLYNYRCFGDVEQTIKIEDITSFIGDNSSGKTAPLMALNCLFSVNSADRVLKRSDFHLPKEMSPDAQASQKLYIEAIFTFDELENAGESESFAIPLFFNSVVVEEPEGIPYLRIRLEATWERSSNLEGAIESKLYYITCPENEEISDEVKITAFRKDLDHIRVIYVPAVRDPSKQLKNVSGTMMNQIMNSINWSQSTQENVKEQIQKLNDHFLNEPGVSVIAASINSQWTLYDNDIRYSDAQLRFNSIDIDSAVKKSEVVFSPTVTGKEYSIDDMSDGLRSLFYISLVDSILDIEERIQEEMNSGIDEMAFSYRPPFLTIIALEEPENHIAPHLIGQLVSNLIKIASRDNAQIALSSHSTAIVKRFDPEKLRFFRFNSCKGATEVSAITLPDEETFANQYKFIKEAVKAYPELYFAKLVILGEGDSEEIILPKIWSAKKNNIDLSGISVVPLGGRHVNHFWRLLSDLKIPYITLLDLDKEREGGGWCRIKYALDQLIKNRVNKEELLLIDSEVLSDEDFDDMSNWDINDSRLFKIWIEQLEKYNVFFSAPLDIDFLMLEQYGEIYKGILTPTEGPRLTVNDNGEKRQRFIKDIEDLDNLYPEYEERVKDAVKKTLKSCGGDGCTYSETQKKLMVWYNYFFLNRGKPSTHIEAFLNICNGDAEMQIPPVFARIITKAEKVLEEAENEVCVSGAVEGF